MKIFEALNLGLKQKTLISLVGGGGKTSIMFRLAKEMKSNSMRVLVTTTTNIYYPDKALYDQFYWWKDVNNLSVFGQAGITVIGSKMIEAMKLKGIDKEKVEKLFESSAFDIVLVEGDGAKGKPVKAPDVHEPVVPQNTSILMGVIGIDCYGKKIDPLWVHRPQILSEITGHKVGDIIDDEVIEKLVFSEKGLFKNCPLKSEKVLFINKAGDPGDTLIAERIGNSVLNTSRDIKRVLIGSVIDKDPILKVLERDKS